MHPPAAEPQLHPLSTRTWPVFADPYYDSHWQYTVPFSIYTTGIAWRKDKVDLDPYTLRNGWQFPWVARWPDGRRSSTTTGRPSGWP